MHEVEKAAVVEEAKRQISRKGFLLSAAGIVVGGGALAALPGMAKAHETDPDVTDREILNYALTLEHLEAAFYNGGVERFSRQLPARQLMNLRRIRNHERRHVTLLTAIIEDEFGEGESVPPLQYNFRTSAYNNVNRFLTVAALLENTGVSAYNGAIAHINEAGYLTAGAQIATVEARHASYLNNVKGQSPFPTALDDAVPPQDICETVKAFISSDTSESPYGPYESYDQFCMDLPDTLQPDVANGTMNNVNAQDTLEEAE